MKGLFQGFIDFCVNFSVLKCRERSDLCRAQLCDQIGRWNIQTGCDDLGIAVLRTRDKAKHDAIAILMPAYIYVV